MARRPLVNFDSDLDTGPEQTVIGLDLSPGKCGLAEVTGEHIVDGLLLKAPEGVVGEQRAAWWRDKLVDVCCNADLVAIEDFAFAQPNRAHEVGGVAYVVRVALAEAGLRVLKVPVGTNKKFATGRGNANKHEMVLAAFKRWGFETKHDDIADALALAKCGHAWLDPQSSRDKAVLDKSVLIEL